MGIGKRVRILVLAAIVAAVVARVGLALSAEPPNPPQTSTVVSRVTTTVGMPESAPAESRGQGGVVSDAAKLFAVGSMLVGVAALLRRNTA
jgi:hypothetical protein